ncbi:hypothetical protein AN2455.2 [Aspergillus nidulans FGSC A4]|nr:hypothetical protein AN2455.2 [Aspergillus nidulans FGSC A4]|eukprot:XP_660059.1 hypothetical protein AN2455.2 [Aspergillus nidulans FGSC A4]
MSADEQVAKEEVFQKPGDLVERNEETGVMQVESLCMNCHENGITRLLLLRVPFFRDIILESFECEHCHFKDNSVKSAGQIQEKGSVYTLDVENEEDMQRQVIRSDVSIFKVESLGIEMPKGESQLTTVEGVIQKIHESLSSEQPLRKVQAPELHDALVPIIDKLQKILDREGYPFTVSLDDPTGNSWIAPTTHDTGHKYRRRDYARTHEQNEQLGIASDPEALKNEGKTIGNLDDVDIVDGKVYSLPADCPACAKECTVNMQKVDIPYFKEVFILSNVCEHCGYRSSDVKTGGEVPEKGKRITLSVETITDLHRDILKSDTCALHSEELEVTVQPGTLGGRFTTVEGLLTEIRDQLKGQIYDIDDSTQSGGDSMSATDKEKWARFFDRLDSAIKGDLKFSITLEDPMANSYVQDLCAPAADPQLKTEEYTRTEEEEEELGLKDMKVEGYEAEANEKDGEENKARTFPFCSISISCGNPITTSRLVASAIPIYPLTSPWDIPPPAAAITLRLTRSEVYDSMPSTVYLAGIAWLGLERATDPDFYRLELVPNKGAQAILGYNFNTKNRATDNPVGRELELQPAAAGVKGPTYLRMEAWNPASYLNGAGPARDARP